MTEPTSETVAPETIQTESDTFPRSYVEELRAEAAEHRTKAREALDEVGPLREALRVAYLKQGTAGVLHDHADLPWSDEFNDPETGLPDVATIKAAAGALAADKPHLARVRGDAGQGFRGDASDAVDLAHLLRAGA
ncbi:hypothetical protein [Nocardioides sp. URHA0032]|uniref:hypothetical protein n=1 Tax=Nocardioides sp. URHA0032 TaxID=1380388 RepID=UPI0006861959|nr:hypothetical protein [Nocardioides sp. URHA0032]